ncbi:hypothetical protein J7E79_15660 [Bacillus sp. ISL-40]|uniref:hypothetical protein n=1 Tax=unclassified Bacillus (in: firmicutes) TaxID=185979 RepID=UPI001BEB014F|nr:MULTISPECIES: hypothetical protein [unclassified Bacillus (in: firmicutes)]MBT2698835.1 hypothetical protein [Bacillus sp. ISL-40]MBT2720720.1 hypothetical protein [Bacillus sp. ISL-46]MBT2741005.1 hypothetical protein [Bacillus sp. ISL-77]
MLGVDEIVLCDTIGRANPKQVFDLLKVTALLLPAMPFIQKILLEQVAYNMGNWMIGEGSKVSKEKINLYV